MSTVDRPEDKPKVQFIQPQHRNLEGLTEVMKETISPKETSDTVNCVKICDDIFIGGEEYAINVDYLKKVGITHILNCAEGDVHFTMNQTDKDHLYKGAGLFYKGIKAEDTVEYNIKDNFLECNTFIDNAIKENGKVLVHCVMGYSRSPTIVAAFLMEKRGKSAKEAIKCIKDKKLVHPHFGFLVQLCQFEDELRR